LNDGRAEPSPFYNPLHVAELLTIAERYGLPGWAVLVIGGGTIVAAVISFLQGIIVAWINAAAAKRLAANEAVRVHRRELAKAVLEQVRAFTNITAPMLSAVKSGEPPQLIAQKWLPQMVAQRESLLAKPAFFIPPPLDSAFRLMNASLGRLATALRTQEIGRIGLAATSCLNVAAAFEVAFEAYVFGIRSAWVRSRWEFWKVRRRQRKAEGRE
jgi:hypothetical protein